jgi:hypothetical protein
MNSIFKILESDSVREAWNEVMSALVVERLKEDYLRCLDWDDIENASAILTVIRYFTSYSEFKQFVDEVKDAGYTQPEASIWK